MATSTPQTINIGQVVRYPDPPDVTPTDLNGYRNFFNLSAMPGAPRLIMNRGIDHPASVTAPEGRRRPVILIRSNPLQAGTAKTPWNDAIDLSSRRIHYFGDHRPDHVGSPENTRGNAALLAAFEEHRAPDTETRAHAVPLLVFRSVLRNGQSKGYLEFCGLGLITSATTVDLEDPKTGKWYSNYGYDINLVDLSSDENRLDWNWINARRSSRLSLDETNELAPAAWRTWIATGRLEANEYPQTPTGARSTDSTNNMPQSLDWTWDELVLACAMVYRNNWREVKKDDQRALELSDLLQLLPIHPPTMRRNDFRSPSSVQRKTADLATAHPSYVGRTTRGGKLTKLVVEQFISHPHQMLSVADQITATLTSADPELLENITIPDKDEDEEVAIEGRLLERVHHYRERDSKLRRAKIDSIVRGEGNLSCEICGFDFSERFGKHGEGYIEVHHLVPLHQTGMTATGLDDLAVLCANCHRMSHRRLELSGTWPTPRELREIVRSSHTHQDGA